MVPVPRLEIGSWPTPIVPLPRVSEAAGCEVLGKLEDHAAWCGNKVRKLEYLLARVPGAKRRVVTAGVGTSSWAAAAAYYSQLSGIECVVGLAGPVPDHLRSLYEHTGTRVVGNQREIAVGAAALAARRAAGRGATWLPFGGSGRTGDLGSAGAGLEIADAVRERRAPRPEGVFVAAGTGGTAGGLIAGLAVGGLPTPVTAVRVTPWPLGSGPLVQLRALRALRSLERAGRAVSGIRLGQVAAAADFFPPGYGRSNPATDEAIAVAATDGIHLEATYGGKAMAAAIAAGRHGVRGPLLVLVTSPAAPLPAVFS